MRRHRYLAVVLGWALAMVTVAPLAAHDGDHPEEGKPEQGWPGSAKGQEVARAFLADHQPALDLAAESTTTCTNGFAGEYPCSNIDLLAFMPLGEIGGGNGNDIWGWTDPSTGKEYALMGRTSGTAFVDISTPTNPVYLGNLPTTRFSSTWRDIKVSGNYAFIVSESRSHGMQVFDLTRLRSVTTPPVTFSPDARYTGFHTAHNVAINEQSGFAYAVGTDSCSGGLHIVDIRTPLTPTQAGCFSADGYTHDVQCVNYTGPDATYQGREICFASNEDTVTIVDVTNKAAPTMLSRVSYPGVEYTHQGWLTDDQRYFLVDDELDESRNGHGTHTYVFDVASLDRPVLHSTFTGTTGAIDHNQFVKGSHSYQSNYRGGLRIIDITNKAALKEVAYFDTYPADTNTDFNGSWSNYPFFESGTVVVSDIERGLFILRPNLGPADSPPSVSITSHIDGEAVSGTESLTASASDGEGAVSRVEFFVDGRSIGVDSTAADGWSVSWDTTATNNGSRVLSATATDSAGQTGTDSISVNVDNPNNPPSAGFVHTCTNLACEFDASASADGDGTIERYSWDFGDGSTGSGVLVGHSYSIGGEYTVVLTVTDNDGASSTTSSVLRIDGPPASMHVADLSGLATSGGSTWTATVRIRVVDASGNAVSSATVAGTWSQGGVSSGSCTTDGNGECSVTSGSIHKRVPDVTFSVTSVSHATRIYDATANLETSITVAKP